MPKLLLVTTQYWPFAARLAIAFQELGWQVEAVCRRGHLLAATDAVTRVHRYRLFGTLDGLQASIEASVPDLILPCDDPAAMRLQQLAARAAQRADSQSLAALIERSLGRSASCALASRRGELMAAAYDAGVRIPATATIRNQAELSEWLSVHGFPAVIKGNGTFGGSGVLVVRTAAEAAQAFAGIDAMPSWLRTFKRLLLNNDTAHLERHRNAETSGTIAQAFVPNSRPANRAVACWQGEVLAGISVIALETVEGGGPATVVEVVEHPEMAETAIRLVRQLGLSGFCGLDFMVDQDSGAAYLIEMNPRATPIAHLSLGPGRDLVAALSARLQQAPLVTRAADTSNPLVALFPTAWWNHPNNPRLQQVFHDVPWKHPALLQACIECMWSMTSWRQRLAARWWRRDQRPQLIAPDGRCYR